jgi:hypothetical protein
MARRRLRNHEESEALAREYLRIVQETHRGSMRLCLFSLAEAAARQGELVRAARPLGITAAAGGPPLKAEEAEEANPLRAALIAELGPDRFAQEEEFGRSLPAEKAMALTLGDTFLTAWARQGPELNHRGIERG